MIIKGYIFSVLYVLLCVALGLILYKLGISKKYTRKTVHILVGFEWLILYTYFGATWHFLAVCIAFTLLLLLSHIKKLLPAMSSDGDNAPGTVYYGVAMTVLSAISLFVGEMMIPFGIGVMCTSFGDGFAGVVGQLVPSKYNPKIFGKKSLLGSLAGLLFSLLVVVCFNFAYDLGLIWWQIALVGIFAVLMELIGVYGLDNIFITLGTAFLTYAFLYWSPIVGFLAPIMLTPVVIITVISKKALTPLGLVFAMVLDLVVSLCLGNFGFILLLFFLFASVAIDKVKRLKKASLGIEKRGDCRDAVQVTANGLIPMVMAILYACTFEPIFIFAYVAVLAEAFADTAASGFGVFSKNTFDLFRWKSTKCGLSGGMSYHGTFASLIAALALSALALPFGIGIVEALVCAGTAFLGVIFDSFLGSVLQVKYQCTVCGEITEKEFCCRKNTKKHSGFEFFDNDVVNLTSGVFTAVITALIFSFM